MFMVRRNPLSFPAGSKPGFNPAHPMAGLARFSAIANGGGAEELINGIRSTMTGTPSSTILSTGLANACSGSPSNAFNFVSRYSAADTSGTIAVIVQCPTLGTAMKLIQTGTSAGSNLNISSGGVFQCSDVTTTNKSSGITLSANVPYFLVCSFNSSTTNFLVKNLNTNIITTASPGTPFLNPGAPGGSYQYGFGPSDSGPVRYLFAGMFAGRFHTFPELFSWANDPWSFWYPNRYSNYIPAISAPPATSYHFMLLMGAGQ